MSRRLAVTVVTALAALGPTSCTRPPPRLYVLNPIQASGSDIPARSGGTRTLAILPVSVPDYLDRRGIVSRMADHRLVVSDSDRWGEGLSGGLARVLTMDLGTLLAKDGFVVTSGAHQAKVDAELALTIDAFERAPDGNAMLAARWMILDEDRSGAASHFQAVYNEPIRSAGSPRDAAAAEVAALNRDLDRLATDIAASIPRSMPKSRRTRTR